MKNDLFSISFPYHDQIQEMLDHNYKNVLPSKSYDEVIFNLLSILKASQKIKDFSEETGVLGPFKGLRILEIGSGLGAQSEAFAQQGAFVVGLEPDFNSIRIASKIHSQAIFINAIGESIPFTDNSFDVIVSYQVLEHVQDPQKVLSEAARLLKPGGVLHLVVPNYVSFWEGHYGLPWLPFFNKSIAKIYVSFFGRRATFIDTLIWITPHRMKRWTSSLPFECRWLGPRKWIERFDTLALPSLALGKWIGPLLKIMKKFHLNSLFAHVTARFGWYYPIILVAKKR